MFTLTDHSFHYHSFGWNRPYKPTLMEKVDREEVLNSFQYHSFGVNRPYKQPPQLEKVDREEMFVGHGANPLHLPFNTS